MNKRTTYALLVGAALTAALMGYWSCRHSPPAAGNKGDSSAATRGDKGPAGLSTVTRPHRGTRSAPVGENTAKTSSNEGWVKLFSPWGGGPGNLGRDDPGEGSPSGPMSFGVDREGKMYVLDQNNGRIVRYGKDGNLLESPKGAKGEMQVLDGTNTDPGFGVKPARDNSPEERARVGRDYLQAMLKRYQGDPALAWAAYNAGPGRVDAALKNAGKPVMVDANADPNAPKQISWLSLMPKETQNYVAKNMAALSGGQGTPPRPTLADLSAQLASDPRLAGNPQRLKIAQEEAARQWKLQEDAIKQREEEGISNAMRMLVANGGRFADLPASMRNAIPPKEVDNVLNFSSRVAKGEDITSPLLYARLSSNPAELARMSDAQFFMLRRELSESDFKHFANERAKQMGGAQGANGPGDLNSAAIKQTLDARMRVLGMDPTPKDDGGADAARIGAVRQFVDQYFVAAQREAVRRAAMGLDRPDDVPAAASGGGSGSCTPSLNSCTRVASS